MPDLLELSLATPDLDRSRRFVEVALGLAPERVGDTSATYATGTCELKLQADFPDEVRAAFNLPAPPAERGGAAMAVLALDEPLGTLYERVCDHEAGEALIEPQDAPWGVRMFLARTPAGHVLEVRGTDS